jgi:hypothetical protein
VRPTTTTTTTPLKTEGKNYHMMPFLLLLHMVNVLLLNISTANKRENKVLLMSTYDTQLQ